MESVLRCLSRGRGFLLNFLCPNLQHPTWAMLTRWTQHAHLVVLDLSHERVEGTLLALVSRGWVSMGFGLKARQHRGPKNPSPVSTQTPKHRQSQGSPPMGSWLLRRSRQDGLEVWLPASEASGRIEAPGTWRDPLQVMRMWLSRNFQLS